MIALSATVAAGGPTGAVWAATPGPAPSLAVAGPVRFEPLGASAGGLTVAGTGSYRGSIEVRPNGRSLAVLNDVALEEYVRGIDEVPPSWPAAALQAQAIAARTYAAHKAVTGEARWRAVGADICATATCQVYRGLDAERKAQGHGWLPAVEATAGRALLEGGRPIMASYSSTANGPRAMSQNGALAMANEGRTAADILAAYYGLRPTVAPGLPAAIKVAVVMSTTTARVSATEPFRVVDAAGTWLATSAAGEWTATVGAGGLRLVPPATDPVTEPAPAPEPEAVVRRATRAVTATAPPPGPGRWALVALALSVAVGASTIQLIRRRQG